MNDTRVILIGGTSHVGKSTFAARLAEHLGWQLLSTDQLARHPGRPWGRALPPDLVSYFSSTLPAQLLEDVLAHYRNNVWPIAEAIVHARVANQFDHPLVLEGSAILPELVNHAELPQTQSLWFTKSDATIRHRILTESDYTSVSAVQQRLIDRFLDRSLLFNQFITDSAPADRIRNQDNHDELLVELGEIT